MILTRYAMLRFKIRKEFFDLAPLTQADVIQTLPDALVSVGTGGNIEHALVRLGAPHNRCGFILSKCLRFGDDFAQLVVAFFDCRESRIVVVLVGHLLINYNFGINTAVGLNQGS